MGTEHLSINALKPHDCSPSCPECFNGERGGEIHQDNFKSVIMTFCYGITNCYGITSVQGKHEINQPKGFLI